MIATGDLGVQSPQKGEDEHITLPAILRLSGRISIERYSKLLEKIGELVYIALHKEDKDNYGQDIG